jgi:positive regulator of sigma E activity
MVKGVICAVDNEKIYLLVDEKDLNKHSHLFPGKVKKRILPIALNNHNKQLKKGSKVEFTINQDKKDLIQAFYYVLPIFSLVSGLSIGIIIARNLLGVLFLSILFLILGLKIKSILKHNLEIFNEIKIKIN